MSDFHVEVTTIDAIEPHPNADRLELAQVKGWQVVVQKGQHAPGERVVYVPPDSVIPQELADEMNIAQYLSHGRLRAIKLRGEPSFGLIMTPREIEWKLGDEVGNYYGITKYMPPTRSWLGSRRPGTVGLENPDALEEHPLFWRYTNIDNLRHFPSLLQEGEEVIVTEKLHGTNSRVGVIQGEWMAGSHRVRRKQPPNYENLNHEYLNLGLSTHVYWFPTLLPSVHALLTDLSARYEQVILFGEILGDTIQSLHYGYNQQLGYRAFDLMLNGKYVDYDEFFHLCSEYSLASVPLLARIPYSFDAIKTLSEGNTTLLTPSGGVRMHMREGVVVKPVHECTHPKIGRCILKYVSDSYLVGKATDFTEE